jgi:hypothetical protein
MSASLDPTTVPKSNHLSVTWLVVLEYEHIFYHLSAMPLPSLTLSLDLLAVAALSGSGVGPAAASATQCDDCHGLLKVTLPDDVKPKGSSRGLYIHLRPSGNVGNSSVLGNKSYNTDACGVAYALCIPRENACFEVYVHGSFSSNDYQSTWDGEDLTVDQELFDELSGFYTTSTELGSGCSLACDEGYGLFDYEEWVYLGPSSFKVENAGGDVVASACNTKESCNEWGILPECSSTRRVCQPPAATRLPSPAVCQARGAPTDRTCYDSTEK